FAQPACAQSRAKKEPPLRPPLDIRPALKDTKSKLARRKAPAKPAEPKPTETAKSADAPAGPTLASASSTPVTLPPLPGQAATPMPDLRPSIATAPQLTPEQKEHRAVARETLPAYMRVRLTPGEIASRAELNPMILKHAEANGIPEALIHRVIMRE